MFESTLNSFVWSVWLITGVGPCYAIRVYIIYEDECCWGCSLLRFCVDRWDRAERFPAFFP